jgi:hypothetical protein
MSKRVKTTQIVKKTKSGKEVTINFAKVVDRINEFRQDNPRGLIETLPTLDGDQILFRAHIVKDKSDKNSAEATGHAFAKNEGTEKQFEKLETIAVGRALAMLGYAASGEVASFEEMEEFAAYRDTKIDELIEGMANCKTIADLRTYFMGLGSYMAESRIIEAKDARKAELNADSGTTAK